MPALKAVQVVIVSASMLTVGGIASHDLWGLKAPIPERVPPEADDAIAGHAAADAWAAPTIPTLDVSPANIGLQLAYDAGKGLGEPVGETKVKLDELAAMRAKKKKKPIRFGAFEGY